MSATNLSDKQPIYSFEDALAWLPGTLFLAGDGPAATFVPVHIQMIEGDWLNESSDAQSWVFTVRHENQTSLVIYDNHGKSAMKWPGAYPEAEISLDNIVKPKELFDRNRDVIFQQSRTTAPERREIRLANGNYTLTISGNGQERILIFDASTGALIS